MALEVQPPQQNKPPVPAPAPEPSKKSRNIAIVIIVVLVVVVVFAAIWFALRSLADSDTAPVTTPTATEQAVPEVNDESDLEKVEEELNQTDIDDLGTGLEQNDEDGSQF